MTDPDRRAGCVGVVGLGHMGAHMAANIARSGLPVVGFDLRPPVPPPAGVRLADSLNSLVTGCEVLVLSLPDAAAVTATARAIGQTRGAVRAVADTSTIGPGAAGSVAALFEQAGISYADAPVSGGVAAAASGRLTVMFAGPPDVYELLTPALDAISARIFRLGDRAGLGQAVKVANNFLTASSLLAASEALVLLDRVGVDMTDALAVINASSGMSAATADKFPKEVVTGRYAAGFAAALMSKDVRLFRDAVATADSPAAVSSTVGTIWDEFSASEPQADFTRIYAFVQALRAEPAR